MLSLQKRLRLLFSTIDVSMAAHVFMPTCTHKESLVRRPRVARLMREQGRVAELPRHRTVTTKVEKAVKVTANLLQRDFHADRGLDTWLCASWNHHWRFSIPLIFLKRSMRLIGTKSENSILD
jgi:transposase InsO family protein